MEEDDAIHQPLSETTEHIKRRLHKRDGVMPLWLSRELEVLARACFRKGKESAHTAKTVPRDLWGDDEATPLVYEDDGR